jgi:predicted ATP-grasp superfamily ATP-dependent carboligase
MPNSLTVLVTDPLQRAALATVRAVGRAGHRVLTIGDTRGLAGVSRYASRHVHVRASDVKDPAAFPEAVREAVRAHRVDVVVPVTDAASRILLAATDRLDTRIAGPSAAAYARASDKEYVLAVAPTVGIDVPQQVVIEDVGDAASFACPWPNGCVIKPARSVVVIAGRAEKVGVCYASSPAHVPEALARYAPEAYPLLIQERCAGEGVGVFLLRAEGRTLLAAGHRRIREKPPSGGVSTCRESVVPDAALLSACERLLDALAYEGPAMVEFKQDPSTGRTALMEINARLWGSVQLSVDAGVNFPLALVHWAAGIPVVSQPPLAGIRCVWELGELDHALAIWRRSAATLNLPPGTPVGAAAAWRALTDRRWSDRAEVFNWLDPQPFVVETLQWFSNVASSSAGRA